MSPSVTNRIFKAGATMQNQSDLFNALHHTRADPARLYDAYDSLLRDLWDQPAWTGVGPVTGRVTWHQGRNARAAAPALFNSPGVYIWGAETRPLYIGRARNSFAKRFSRYIWSRKSQCNLARDYEGVIRADGVDGFPEEVRAWYRRGYGNSLVRLEGAVRFAREGIDDVWFYLLPHVDPAAVGELERALVPVAQLWNEDHDLLPLLNKEFNRRRGSTRIRTEK